MRVLKVLLRLYVDLLKFLAETIDDVARSFTEKTMRSVFQCKTLDVDLTLTVGS